MARSKSELKIVMDQKAANGIGNWINVGDYRHMVVSIDGNAAANLTIKCVGSIGKGGTQTGVYPNPDTGDRNQTPDPTAAQSRTNSYEYVQMVQLDAGGDVDGPTGVAFAAAAGHHLYSINVDGLEWLNFIVSSYVAGQVSVYVRMWNDAV